MPERKISEVIKRHSDELMAIPGVMGIAEGKSKGKPCIRIFVDSNFAQLKDLPSTLEGYLVQVEESGEFRKR